MKELKYEVKAKGWSGHVMIDMPSYKEKLAILKEVNIKVGAGGAVASDDNAMEMVEKLYAKMEKLVKAVDLVHEGGTEVKSLDDLGYYAEGQEVIQEIQGVLTQGISLGK